MGLLAFSDLKKSGAQQQLEKYKKKHLINISIISFNMIIIKCNLVQNVGINFKGWRRRRMKRQVEWTALFYVTTICNKNLSWKTY